MLGEIKLPVQRTEAPKMEIKDAAATYAGSFFS